MNDDVPIQPTAATIERTPKNPAGTVTGQIKADTHPGLRTVLLVPDAGAAIGVIFIASCSLTYLFVFSFAENPARPDAQRHLY